MRTGPSRWRHWLLPLAAIVALALLWEGRRTGPFDPAGREYGANWPGDLVGMLKLVAIELAVLYALLRPWSYHRSPGRAAIALVLFGPYMLVSFLASMHAGSVVFAHVVWLVLVTIGLFVTLVCSAVAAAGYAERTA